jgi:TIR domain
MPTKRKLRVFLCHASQDKSVVRELYQRMLTEDWIDPWLDEEKLLPGQDWNLEIEKAVESSDAVIVCVSSTSVAKEGYVQKELRQVLNIALEKLEGAIFVLPVRLDDCSLPRQLRDKQFLDYFPTSKQAAAYDKLKASLNIRKDNLGV